MDGKEIEYYLIFIKMREYAIEKLGIESDFIENETNKTDFIDEIVETQ
jgi:hypothetical protein